MNPDRNNLQLIFPAGFLWGAAGSSYQTEGNNTNADWWAWEHSVRREDDLRKKGKNPEDYFSGVACDFFNRFDEDFSLAEQLNHNTTRIGVEWSRIEPKEGVFDEKALEHYEKILESAKKHGLKVFLTLHHYTNPVWFAEKGAFLKKENIKHFENFVMVVAKRLGKYVDFWITLNEPTLYANLSYFSGYFPPQMKSLPALVSVVQNLIHAHKQVHPILKQYAPKPIGIAFNLMDIQSTSWLGPLIIKIENYFNNEYVINKTNDFLDFIGVNYYIHHHVGIFGFRKHSHSRHVQTDVGWGIHPEGLERGLLNVKKYNKPIYITENGLADAKDTKREKFIKDHLFHVYEAIMQGCQVKGYLYWSLIDNFEWAEGFVPRFGLIEIDRDDFLRRKIRHSALKFAEICKKNVLEIPKQGYEPPLIPNDPRIYE